MPNTILNAAQLVSSREEITGGHKFHTHAKGQQVSRIRLSWTTRHNPSVTRRRRMKHRARPRHEIGYCTKRTRTQSTGATCKKKEAPLFPGRHLGGRLARNCTAAGTQWHQDPISPRRFQKLHIVEPKGAVVGP